MKIALAMIVKGSDEEALLLDRCLSNMKPYVDGIFITRTQPNDAVGRVTKKHKAVLSDFTWIDDFAAARNFNFSQVPKDFDYILWSDADDAWRGLEKLRSILEAHPNAEAFGFWYLYAWDEFKKPTVVHRKTMLVKHDGSTKWVGTLHEDLEPTRHIEVELVEGIERLHLSSEERASENAKRNVRISEKQVSLDPNDPRSYWNLGQSQYGVGAYDEARETFHTFIEVSESDAEKYIAYSRLADIAIAQGKRHDAQRALQLAIGLQPNLPDAYLQAAQMHFSFGDIDKAEEYCLMGVRKRPQIHQIIAYNPRDYDYKPLFLLAQIYYQKNRPDLMLPVLEGCLKIYPKDKRLKEMVKECKAEKDLMAKALERIKKLEDIPDPQELQKAIDKLPQDLRSHPAVAALRNTRIVKTESSGRDLVIYCGHTTHQWNPEMFKTKGVGGSEEAVIHLAREWAKQGWNVTVYNNCGHKTLAEAVDMPEGIRTFVHYRPFWEWNYRDKQDVVILWRWARPLDADINADRIFVDVHDVVPPGEFTENRRKKVTKILVKTEFHRSLFPNVPDDKIAVIPNGFEGYLDPSIEKDPYLVINTSSPDRSLDVLPKLWKEVRKQVPEAKLQWAYGWDIFDQAHQKDPKKLAWKTDIVKEMADAGIEVLGRLAQSEVGKLYQKASFLAYPSTFAEIFCISVLKAQAAGCMPITSDFGAFAEINKFGVQTHTATTKDNWHKPYQFHYGIEDEKEQKSWIDAMVKALKTNATMPQKKVDEWVTGFAWSAVAKEWDKFFRA